MALWVLRFWNLFSALAPVPRSGQAISAHARMRAGNSNLGIVLCGVRLDFKDQNTSAWAGNARYEVSRAQMRASRAEKVSWKTSTEKDSATHSKVES